MAKIGTAHVEIKPVLNEEALNELCARVEEAVANAVTRAIHSGDHGYLPGQVHPDYDVVIPSPCDHD